MDIEGSLESTGDKRERGYSEVCGVNRRLRGEWE